MYQGISAKNCSRDKRGQSETRVHLKSLEQKMLCNKEWLAFLHNTKIKQHLNLLVNYLCADDFVQSSPLSVYWLITTIRYLKSQGVSQRFLNA